MSEDQIERAVERMVDAVDARFMRGGMSSTEYNSEMRKIDAWADERRAENAA